MAMPKGAMVKAPGAGRYGEHAGLTPMEINYVRHFVKSANSVEAARYAGYADPETQAILVSRSPKVQLAISKALMPKLSGLLVLTTDLTERRLRAALESDDPKDQIPLKELRGLLSILTDKLMPASAMPGGGADVPRAASAADLQAQIDRLQAMKSDLARVVDATDYDVIPTLEGDASQSLEVDDS